MEQPAFNHYGFNHFLSEGKLMGCRCRACGALLLPPRPMCPNCYSTDMEWVQLSGQGTLIGYTTIYVGLSAMIQAGYNRDHPYQTGVVRLAEGPTISGRILPAGDDPAKELEVGLPVTAAFIERSSGPASQSELAFKRRE